MMLAIPIPIIWIEVVNPRAVPGWGIEHFLISNNVKNYYEGKKERKKKGASCLTKFSRFFFYETGFLVIVNLAKPFIWTFFGLKGLEANCGMTSIQNLLRAKVKVMVPVFVNSPTVACSTTRGNDGQRDAYKKKVNNLSLLEEVNWLYCKIL